MDAVDIIRRHISEMRISQAEISHLTKLSYGTINRVLNKKQPLKTNTLILIAEALHLPFYQLIDNQSPEIMESNIQGYIEYNGVITKISSFNSLQKLYEQIEYETKVLPKEVKELKALNKEKKAEIRKNHPNRDFQFILDWDFVGEYDAERYDIWAFKTAYDEKDGIRIDLGNQCGGYPFVMNGYEFPMSEQAYLCGQFSLNTEECIRVQHQLYNERSGLSAKKYIKTANTKLIRADWEQIRAEWMLYVIWHKCKNADFAKKLMSIPKDAIIIENSTTVHEATNIIWGSINPKLEEAREKVALYAELKYMEEMRQKKKKTNKSKLDEIRHEARNEIHHIGTFSGGQNLMGKVLKRCQLALLNGTEPEINYDLLREKKIYLFGKLLTF